MSISNKMANEQLRKKYLGLIRGFLKSIDEDVYEVKSNEVAFPVVDANEDEKAIVITVKVPTGADKGREPYDVYAEAENYEHELKEKEEKKKKREEEKAKKIAKDKERRAKTE